MAGTLYLVATPIGHLEDITHRALRVLREVAVIAAEDTRVTRRLLAHYDLHTPLVSYHEHSTPAQTEKLVRMLQRGDSMALVSDAGTPGISDPARRLVARCAEEGIAVSPIPGPSALTAALSASGFPALEVLFVGFLPSRGAERRAALERLAAHAGAVVLFEAPHRALRTLADLAEVVPDRAAVACRELTKRFEDIRRGQLAELHAHFAAAPPRGELTIVLGPADSETARLSDAEALARVRALRAQGQSLAAAVREVSPRATATRQALYRLAVERDDQ